MDKLIIGEVLKPQGVRGELKVRPYVDNVIRFKNLKNVYIDEQQYKILSIRIATDAIFVSLSGIPDRNVAETFRGKFLLVDRENAVTLPKDSYFIVDIVDCQVSLDNGEVIGTVIDVTKATKDIFTVKRTNGVVRFPFLKDAVVNIDIKNKSIVLSAKRFSEIAVFDKI